MFYVLDNRVIVIFIQYPTRTEARDTMDSKSLDPRDLRKQAADALNMPVRLCALLFYASVFVIVVLIAHLIGGQPSPILDE